MMEMATAPASLHTLVTISDGSIAAINSFRGKLRKLPVLYCVTIRRVLLLLLDSSTDPKLVFLDNGKSSVKINLAEFVHLFCKDQPNVCFG
jgi:hypothetical protein